MRAVSAAVNIASRFDPMADDLASAVFTFGRKGMDGAFEAIEVAGNAIVDNFQRFVVFISTNFTLHNKFSSLVILQIHGLAACLRV